MIASQIASHTPQSPIGDLAPSPPPQPKRSLLIDILRGLSIALVVLGHTDEGMIHRFWWGTSDTGFRLKLFIYSFHMPAFFFVSGIFLCASVAKRGGLRFTTEKLRTMIYPYLVWACVFAPVPIFFGQFLKAPAEPWGRFLLDVATGAYSWFLPTIFFTVVLGMLLRRIPMPLLFVLSCIASLYWPVTGLVFVDRGLKHLPFLVLGMWVGRSFERMEKVPLALAAAAVVVLCVAIAVITGGRYVYSPYLFLPLGLLGTLMLLLVSHCLSRTALARLLAWAGAGSIGVFLLSAYFQVAGREILLRLFHTTAPYPQLILPSLLALLLPAWIYQHRVRLHIGWMFVWPFHDAQRPHAPSK